ncbi:MAG: ABC transporter substrate-binding protein [Solirubrobacteraceae bacterium]
MRLFSARRGGLAAFVVVSLASGAVASAAPAASPTGGADRVRLPFPAYDGTLTPYTFGLGYPLVTLVYDTLLWRDADGVPRPWLARSITRSVDGRRLTIRLRDGVRWHDGRPLTAADVAFTFRYVAAHDQPRFTPELGDVQRVRATGRLTATIDLRRPSLGFDDQPLADLPILPRHLWRGLPAGRLAPPGLPVGSGPYRLVSARPDQGYVLRANRGYFLGTPRVREIRVPIIGDAGRTYQALRDRQVDMVPLSLPEQAAMDLGSTLGIGVRRGPSYSGTALVLNTRRPPFDRPPARRAVAAALDLELMVRKVAPAVAAQAGFIHPASRWSAGARLHRFDPRATRMALAGQGAAPIRVLAPDNDPVRLEAGRQVVLALQRAGAGATLVKLSRAQLDHAIGADGSAPDFDAAIETTPPLASFDPDGLTRLFGSDPRVASLNVGGYRSAAFDTLARRVASAPDPQARRRATRAELELLARDVPAVPLFFSVGTFAFRPAIYDGWVFVKGTGILDKRSFLPGATADGRGSQGPSAVPGRADSGSGSGLSVVNVISLLVLAIVAALAVTALLQRRSARKR